MFLLLLYPQVESLGLYVVYIVYHVARIKNLNILHNRIEIIEIERQYSKSNRIERNINRYTPTVELPDSAIDLCQLKSCLSTTEICCRLVLQCCTVYYADVLGVWHTVLGAGKKKIYNVL